MIPIGALVIGFVVGFVVGRWFVLLLAIVVGIWVWRTTGVEIPHWLLGLLVGGSAAIGMAGGVAARRMLTKAQ